MTDEPVFNLLDAISDLNKMWSPHPHQHAVLHSIFKLKLPEIMVECGRKWGKTEIDAYVLWRWAMTVPGEYYYFAPLQTQAKEILWAPGRIQSFGPQEYVSSINNTDMRISFTNGSFIKVDGSDNFNKYRGPNPKGAVYDEYRDFRPEFHRAFGPNLATHKGQLLLNGSPPEIDVEHYMGMLKVLREVEGAYFNYPSWCNEFIDKDWLRREKAKLYARGEGDVWEREYGAKHVRGGANAIFPMFRKSKFVRSHDNVIAEIEKDRRKLVWTIAADPGNATVFGVLFIAYNPYSKKAYILDEIYEKEQANTSTSRIIPRIRKIKEDLYPLWQARDIDWMQCYDEAATWFNTEAMDSFDEYFFPTQKSYNKKDEGLSLIKDLMLSNRLVISDRCEFLCWEIANYIKDKNGKPIKENDHLIDCMRYANAASGVNLVDEKEPEDAKAWRRYHTPATDIQAIEEERGLEDTIETGADLEDYGWMED